MFAMPIFSASARNTDTTRRVNLMYPHERHPRGDGAMVPPRMSKLSKVVHIVTYKGRRSPREKRKRKLKPQWGFNSKRPTSATQKINSATVLDMQRLCRMLMLLFDIPLASAWACASAAALWLGPRRGPSSIFLRCCLFPGGGVDDGLFRRQRSSRRKMGGS